MLTLITTPIIITIIMPVGPTSPSVAHRAGPAANEGFAMDDVQNHVDERGIALGRVGVTDLQYPIVVLDQKHEKPAHDRAFHDVGESPARIQGHAHEPFH